jgi:hypothetical protein
MRHCQCSASTATGDTTKTSIGSITLTAKAKKIVGFGAYATGGAGNTTLENVSGILDVESSDLSIAPQQYPLDTVSLTGTGMATLTPRIWAVDIPCGGGEVLTGYVTLDLAQTINPSARWFVITES